MAAESGKPEACVLADVFHIFKSSGHFAGLRLLGPGTLGIFHVNDYPSAPEPAELNDSHRVYPGDGVAPLRNILKTLQQIGYRGPLSLELFNKSYWQRDPLTVAKTGLEKMKAAVEGGRMKEGAKAPSQQPGFANGTTPWQASNRQPNGNNR